MNCGYCGLEVYDQGGTLYNYDKDNSAHDCADIIKAKLDAALLQNDALCRTSERQQGIINDLLGKERESNRQITKLNEQNVDWREVVKNLARAGSVLRDNLDAAKRQLGEAAKLLAKIDEQGLFHSCAMEGYIEKHGCGECKAATEQEILTLIGAIVEKRACALCGGTSPNVTCPVCEGFVEQTEPQDKPNDDTTAKENAEFEAARRKPCDPEVHKDEDES